MRVPVCVCVLLSKTTNTFHQGSQEIHTLIRAGTLREMKIEKQYYLKHAQISHGKSFKPNIMFIMILVVTDIISYKFLGYIYGRAIHSSCQNINAFIVTKNFLKRNIYSTIIYTHHTIHSKYSAFCLLLIVCFSPQF